MKTQISIPTPCHEDWNNMAPVEKGRFCSSCVKSVIDFTEMDDTEISSYMAENGSKRICGLFRNEQLEPAQIQIPESFLASKMPFHRAFFFAALAVMGSTLFSCTGHDGQTIGKIAIVKDTVPPPVKDTLTAEDSTRMFRTLGIVATPPDTGNVAHFSTPHPNSVPKAKSDKK